MPPPPPRRLIARLITDSDADELTAMRKACGWGSELVPLYITRTTQSSPDMAMFLFFLPSSSSASSPLPTPHPSPPPEPIPVAMGALEFVDRMYGDPELADPVTHRVLVSKLYVHKEFEGQGFGGEVMDFLEEEAERRGAKVLTINTTPYKEDGCTPGVTRTWYERRGYKEFRKRRPWYSDPEDASRPKIVACFLERKLGGEEGEGSS